MVAKSITSSFAALALTAGGSLFTSIQPVSAVTITENTTTSNATTFFPGQSVTTGNGGPWDNITFNWFLGSAGQTPAALGTLFLLSQAYSGTPNQLSSANPGFIAQSQSILNGQYIFNPSVLLQPNTQYFFYANASGFLAGENGNPYPGGTGYATFGPNSSFSPFASDVAFRLSGTPATTTPIPTPALLPGLIGLSAAALRKRKGERSEAVEQV